MIAPAATKLCAACREEKPLAAFYANAGRARRASHAYCIPCHNEKCAARVKASPALQRRNQGAKKRWGLANPVAKRIHEGSSVFLHRREAPPLLQKLERAVMAMGGSQ